MDFSKIKTFSLSAFSLLAVTSTAFAGNSKVDKLETQMNEVGTKNARGTFGAKTAPDRVAVKDGSGWFVGLDILYWKADLSNNNFVQGQSGGTQPGQLPNNGDVFNIKYDWDGGVKALVGYHFEYDAWDLTLKYNYYSASGSTTKSSGNGQNLLPLRGMGDQILTGLHSTGPEQFGFCTRSKGSGELSFQTLDLDLSRAYFVSSKLSLNPSIGIRSAWIRVKERVEYTGGEPYTEAVPANTLVYGLQGNTVHVNDSSKTWGIGPQIGLDTKWHVGCGFSIFGDVSSSLIYTYFNLNHDNYLSIFSDSNSISTHLRDHQFIPNVDLFLGLRWDGYFNEDRQHFGIGLGWETQYWWSEYRRLEAKAATNVGTQVARSQDLSLQGMTLTLQLDF